MYNLSSFSILNFILPLYGLNFVVGAPFVNKAENSYRNASFFNLGSVDRFQAVVLGSGWENKLQLYFVSPPN